jgi:hypothetical protein
LVGIAAVLFTWTNVHNAGVFAPQWGQDLAFFHQLVHSAANGGPWASPLLFEPQGMLDMVHTHLVLPLVVGVYAIWPTQSALLALHSSFAALTLWPALRLGEAVGGRRHGLICALAVLSFGPFQAVATGDFRPVVLFLPGIVGVWAYAWQGKMRPMLLWAIVALLGRQEASYLLICCALALLLTRWGKAERRHALALLGLGLGSLLLWIGLKEQMFFHINPASPSAWPTSAELWDNRQAFGMRFGLSGWILGLASPATLLASLPVLGGMLNTSREWHALGGPGVHHHAFWLPFFLAGGIVACARIPRGFGPLILLVCGALAFPWSTPVAQRLDLGPLVQAVPEDARVATTYDAIHALAGRAVLWNVEQFYQPDRPRGWKSSWPLTLDDVDWLLINADHAVAERATDWTVIATGEQMVLLARP